MAFDNIHLEKGMYHEAGRSFTQVLEQLDPSEGYRGTPLENTDAFQRQLKRFGIRVKGAGSDTVEKFFSTFESAVLFPEFLARAVRQGMDEANILPAITATVTRIDAMDYRSIYSVPEEADRSLAYVAEGASIPATAIRTREHLVRLYKRGRMLVASYEALRFQKLDLFSVMLRQIGAQIQAMHLEDAVNVLRNGDGNDNAAAVFTAGTSPISGEQGTLTYAQLVEFWAQFAPYEMNTMLVSNATMVRLLKLTELQNPLTGLNFQGTGKFETPLGASLLRTQAMADGCILAFDRRYALEMVQAGDVAWNMTSSSTASSSARPSRPSPASARSARRRRRCSRYDGHERGDHGGRRAHPRHGGGAAPRSVHRSGGRASCPAPSGRRPGEGVPRVLRDGRRPRCRVDAAFGAGAGRDGF